MTTQIENTGTLERRLKMDVASADLGKQVADKLRQLSKTVKMAGFRPGKVPLKVVERSYGASVQAEVLGELVGKAFNDAVNEHKLRVAGDPRIEPAQGAAEGAISFTATFEVYPEFDLADAAAAELVRFGCTVTDAEVDKTVDILRKQRASWNEASGTAAGGLRATIDFAGMLDGVAFDGGTATDFPFVLGEGRMLPDFEAGVRGLGVGETRQFPVNFPADYGSKDLAGKTAEFSVTLKKLESPQLPEVNGDFAVQLGIADGDVERMKSELRANLEREVSERLRARNKLGVMDALPALASFELPKALVESESGALAERMKADLKARGMDVKNIPVPPEAFREQAEKRVRLGLLVAEIVRREKLQAKPDQIRKHIEELSRSYENPAEVVRHYFSNRDLLAQVESLVVEQNVVDWFLSKAKVQDQAIAFDELMSQQG
ncbi:MAG: trigger factor [Betaproteobacteria bacterium]